jgi:hypothetical protein
MALPIKDFIIQQLLEYDSSFDVGNGVPTTGLLIDPLSVILQPVIDELTIVQASQSILTILESSDPDSFPEDIVDGLAANAFVERSPGAIGSDVQRIRFFEPQAFSSQQGVLIFRGPAGQRFSNSESIAVTSAEMSLNQEGTLYFIDIPIVALEEGEDFNVSAGSITSMEAEPVGVANLTNLFGIADGRSRETNTELIDRIKVAVTVRALVTGRGIIVTLTENFTTIEEIEPIGFGDAEMMRDIVYNVHIGGNVDVYIKNPSFTSSSKDVFVLQVDTTRQAPTSSTVVALVANTGFFLGKFPIDRTSVAPTVRTIDSIFTYDDGVDWTISDIDGQFFRIGGGAIFHIEGAANAAVTTSKILTLAAAFSFVRPGMILTLNFPGSVAGTYTVKSKIDDDNIEIYGTFPVASQAGVTWQVDDMLVVTYEYNPITIDIIKESRSASRDDFTITDVPLMYIESIELLDPLSGDPTGAVLSKNAGYGAGGYGAGGYGVGNGADFKFVVAEPTLRHSELEDNYIEVSSIFVGSSVRVNYQYANAIPAIQAFMDDRNNQSETASLLARHFIPVYVDGGTPIIYDIPAANESTAISLTNMTTLLKDSINAIDEEGDLELSDIVDLLYDNGATRVDLGTLNFLKGEIHNHDGSIQFTLPDDGGSIVVPDDEIADPTDKPLSPRIARFRSRDITLERNVI